jgi:hypothetical protein
LNTFSRASLGHTGRPLAVAPLTVASSIEDPILKMCYLGLLVLFLTGISLQLRWIKRHPVKTLLRIQDRHRSCAF